MDSSLKPEVTFPSPSSSSQQLLIYTTDESQMQSNTQQKMTNNSVPGSSPRPSFGTVLRVSDANNLNSLAKHTGVVGSRNPSSRKSRPTSLILTRSSRFSNLHDTRLNKSNEDEGFDTPGSARTIKRSTGVLNLDEASMGSPVTRRPSAFERNDGFDSRLSFVEHNQGVPSKRPLLSKDTSPNPAKLTFLKPNGVVQLQAHSETTIPESAFDNFMQSSRKGIRKMKSLSNITNSRTDDQLHASDLYTDNHHASPVSTFYPLSNTSPSPSPVGSQIGKQLRHSQKSDDDSHQSHLPRHSEKSGISRPKMKFNASIVAEYGPTESKPSDNLTPDNYKFVKPLQTAFMSTGLLSKRNRMKGSGENINRVPPDTPCKRTAPSTPTPAGLLRQSNEHSIFDTLNKSAIANSSPFMAHIQYSNSNSPYSTPNNFNRTKLGLRDSKLRFSVDFRSPNRHRGLSEDSQDPMHGIISSAEEDTNMPPTPTKDHNLGRSDGLHHSYPIPIAAERQISDGAKTITLNDSEHYSIGLSTSSSAGHHWLETGSADSFSDQASSSPQTPEVFLQPAKSESELSGRRTSVGDDIIASELPKTPAKTPKTPLYPLFGTSIVSSDRQKLESLLDPVLTERFDKVTLIGRGEFSMVYAVSARNNQMNQSIDDNRYAVKRTKHALSGPKSRSRRLEEVEIVRSLSSFENDQEW